MTVEVIFDPTPQRTLCSCGVTLEYTKDDLKGYIRASGGDGRAYIKCPVCGYHLTIYRTTPALTTGGRITM